MKKEKLKKISSPYQLFKVADRHGEESGEPDHTVGDLQQLLDVAWNTMTPSQRDLFLCSTAVREVVVGAVGEKEADKILPTY